VLCNLAQHMYQARVDIPLAGGGLALHLRVRSNTVVGASQVCNITFMLLGNISRSSQRQVVANYGCSRDVA
jgi:hypothetical protein